MTSDKGWMPKEGDRVVLSAEGLEQSPNYRRKVGRVVKIHHKWDGIVWVKWDHLSSRQHWHKSLLAPSPPSSVNEKET